jgi:hypothetical protein
MDTNTEPAVELRSTPRKAIRRPAQVMAQANTLMYAITTDISSSGLGLVVPYPLGSERAYEFVFDVSFENEKRQIQFSGVVAYCTAIGAKGYRTGIRIAKVHPASQHTFNSLIQLAA